MATQTFLDWLIVGLRWAHIVAILGWVGASLYFNWLESKLRTPDPARDNVLGEAWMGHGGGFYIVEKRQIAAGHVPSPVYWFRVEAGVTWLTGFLLLVFVYYWTGGVDLLAPETSVLSPKGAIAFAVGLMLIAWFVYDVLWASRFGQEQVTLVNVVSLVLLFAVVCLLCTLFNGRAAFIHVGAILGTNMVFSVWTRIIPSQEEAVAATAAGRERNAVFAVRARRRALHNTYMTLPVVFTMIAVHAPGAYAHPLNWLVLSLLIVAGIAARHCMILFDRGQPAMWAWGTVAASLVALGLLTAPAGVSPPSAAPEAEGRVPFAVVRGIVELRCASCHAKVPSDRSFASAAGGLSFATPEEITARAAAIKASTLVTRTMPPNNKTRMTEEERALLGRWVDRGARVD
jgi:uncharacterized membrane protein